MDEKLWSKGTVFRVEVFRGKTNSGNILRMSAEVEWGWKPRARGKDTFQGVKVLLVIAGGEDDEGV